VKIAIFLVIKESIVVILYNLQEVCMINYENKIYLLLQINFLRMIQDVFTQSLIGLRKAETIYGRVVQLSELIFREEVLENKEDYLRELKYLLEGVKGVDTILTIFNHKTYLPELEVGEELFWGFLPHEKREERMKKILSILHKDYTMFPVESINWFTSVVSKIPFPNKENMKIHHCCMRFIRDDKKQIRLFSQGVPVQMDEEGNFKYTLNYIQNINHLIKKDFPFYWIRLSYGEQNEFVQTFHSDTKEYSKNDLLSVREKEVLLLIAEDLDTKEIAQKLFISKNTVGNHRSNMIERLGARDTTALVQLAKMTGMI
jgi:DNA-binding CsgD family transcriptional regulator